MRPVTFQGTVRKSVGPRDLVACQVKCLAYRERSQETRETESDDNRGSNPLFRYLSFTSGSQAVWLGSVRRRGGFRWGNPNPIVARGHKSLHPFSSLLIPLHSHLMKGSFNEGGDGDSSLFDAIECCFLDHFLHVKTTTLEPIPPTQATT